MTARWGWFLAVPLAISLALTAGTQFIFIEKSFFRELGFGQVGPMVGFANYVAALRNPLYLDSIVTTLRVSVLATVGCLLIGYPLAYLIARIGGRRAIAMLTSVLLTSLVSAPIKVLGLIIIFSKDGALNRFLVGTGITDAPLNVLGNEAGVVLGLIYYSLAFCVLLLYSVICTIPVVLEDAATINGAGRARTFWRVVIPLSLPGICAVALTIFSLSMGAFAAAALMGGGRVLTLPVLIYQTIFLDTKYATASTLSAILLIMVLLINAAIGLLISALTATSFLRRLKRSSPGLDRVRDFVASRRISVGRHLAGVARPAGYLLSIAWIGATYVLLFAPLLVVTLASFNGGSFRAGAVVFPPRSLSLDWYLATPYSHVHAFGVSLLLALIATALACLIAVPAGLGLVRSRVPGREVIGALFRVPLQIPVVIIGLSFFYAYYAVDYVIGTNLAGSFAGLIIAHFFILTPFVVSSVVVTFLRFDEHLEEAATSLGAGRWRTFRRVTLPVITPGLFAGAIYAFMVSFGDVPVSLFLAGSDTVPFPVVIFHSMEMDFDTRVLSSSTLAMAFGLMMLLVVQKLIGLDSFARSQAGVRS